VPSYYNENDPKAAAWLRELIAAELIPNGTVDERSICDVRPQDLYGFEQVHFFAGIGGWSLALRLAGWPAGVPVWTGSCPCQPFSSAGKGKGEKDSRHLWPEMRRLIDECGPAICFGEQVASKAGRGWLARVRTDLEDMGYAVGASDLCAAGVGAPHIRQRLYWLAYAGHTEQRSGQGRAGRLEEAERGEACQHIAENGMDGRLGNSAIESCERDAGSLPRTQAEVDGERITVDGDLPIGFEYASSGVGGLGNADKSRPQGFGGLPECPDQRIARTAGVGFWSEFELIPCRDGKARRIEPGTFPLAHGVSGRVGLLRGYGNAIVPQAAAEFVGAFLDIFNN
jgi:DNA (cytosine-5)-methyltransferase 1